MIVKELDSYLKFRIKEITNLTDDKEVKLFHDLITKSIILSNSIDNVLDLLLHSINNSEIPYCLIDLNRFNGLLNDYLYN